MKFEFELDGIDAQNLYGLFQSDVRHTIMRMFDAQDGLVEYATDVPAYVRGCINSIRQTDILCNKVNPEFKLNSEPMIAYWIAKYGENTYENDEYTGYRIDGEEHV